MKKNIYITTFQNAYNYGAVLQCYALQETIKKYEKNVQVINYDNNEISDFYKVFFRPRTNNLFKKYFKSTLSALYYYKRLKNRNKSFESFISENINLTKLMKYEEIINMKLSKNDLLITGSDQVWNTNLTNGFDDIYFLNFSEVQKMSYAASIGRNKINSKDIEKIKDTLNKYKYISVREETGKKLLNEIIDKNIDVVLDPTLLLNKEDWEKHLSNKRIISKDYIFVYMPNPECIKIAKNIAKKENLKIVNISKKTLFGTREINKFDANPFDFIELLRDAKYIVTSSFHATVFSILFEKKFFVVPPQGVSSRITDLLNKIGLIDRCLNDYNDFKLKKYLEDINYENVEKILYLEREKSLNALKDNL